MSTIVQRVLTETEAELIVNKIKSSPNITGYSFSEWLEFTRENLLIAENEKGEMIGVCCYYDFSPKWSYLAVLYVFEEYRGEGIGKKLFYQACANILESKKSIYISTRTPAVIKMMNDLGFTTFDTLLTLPEPFKEYELDFLIRGARWVLNSYRLKEIIRKALIFQNQPGFLYGIKSCEPITVAAGEHNRF